MASPPEKVPLNAATTPYFATTEALIKDLLLKESIEAIKKSFKKEDINKALIDIMWDIVELYLSHRAEDVAEHIPSYQLPTKSLEILVALAQKHSTVINAMTGYSVIIWENRTVSDQEFKKYFEFYEVDEKYHTALLDKVRYELKYHPHGRLIMPTLSLYQRPDSDIMVRFLMPLVRTGKTDEAIYALLHELKIECAQACLEEARRQVNPAGPLLNQLIMPSLAAAVPTELPPAYASEDPLQQEAQSLNPNRSSTTGLEASQLALLTEEVRSLRDLMHSQAIASSSFSSNPPASPLRFYRPATPPGNSPTTPLNNCAEDFISFILDNQSYRLLFVRYDMQESDSALDARISRFAVQQLSKTLNSTTAKMAEMRALQSLESKWQKALDKTIDDTYQIICDDLHYFSRFQQINEYEQLEEREDTELRLLWLIKFCVKKIALPSDISPDFQEMETIRSIISEISADPKLRKAQSTSSF